MIIKDKAGDRIELTLDGECPSEIEISDARYLCDSDREVEDETLDWIMEHHYQELYEERIGDLISAAEYQLEDR